MTEDSINTIFESLDSKQFETLKSGIKEISLALTEISQQKEAIKDIISSLKEETNIPKKLIRKISKIYFDRNFDEISTEFNELESIYTKIV